MMIFLGTIVAESNDVGTPYVDFKKATIESAVLSKDGKNFYTLQGQDLIYWDLSPLKKIKTWKLPLELIFEGKHTQKYHNIYFTDDYKKVLISSISNLVLYNLETSLVEKRAFRKNHSLVKDGDLLYLARIDQKGDKNENGELVLRPDLHLEVWSISKLKKVKSINVTKQSDDFSPHLLRYRDEEELIGKFEFQSRYQGELLVENNLIYYFAITNKVAVIDKNSLELKNILWEEVPIKKTADDFLVIGTKIYNLSSGLLVLEFPKNDFKSVEKFLRDPQRKPITRLPRSELKRRVSSSVGNLYLMYGKPTAPYIFFRKDKKTVSRIGQYKGELIIMDTNMSFEVSSKEFELLKMKDKIGEIVPINRATYEKYHKPLTIKEK